MANILKKTVAGLLDKMLTPARVLAVRAWQPATLYEVDAHLPTVDMAKWDTIKRVKCKVDDFAFRDYTPALWNADQNICTLYIEAGHNGAGSRWVQRLKTGDEILLSVAHAAPLPAQEGKILCLADGSALGHCLGLKQLTDRQKYPMDVAVYLHDPYEIPTSLTENNTEFEFITQPHGDRLALLEKWYTARDVSAYSSIYIAGNIPMVTALRRKLKALPAVRARIYSHGFWS
ncbi:siderophore-interacting protein [Larkinella insperata]|uniref:Siderophore-interacting protein n=1 Tax=Larkinella insperata TaxID=332158 RepID=A0ABW3Q3G9_9BACT|nr:siderophore-interacting protein [Larkinella insperata]